MSNKSNKPSKLNKPSKPVVPTKPLGSDLDIDKTSPSKPSKPEVAQKPAPIEPVTEKMKKEIVLEDVFEESDPKEVKDSPEPKKALFQKVYPAGTSCASSRCQKALAEEAGAHLLATGEWVINHDEDKNTFSICKK